MHILYYPDFQPPSDWLRPMLLFADSVTRIVPLDCELHDSRELLNFSNLLGDSFISLPPEENDLNWKRETLDRLDLAFREIAAGQHTKSKDFKVIVDPIGRIMVEGYSFLHRSKISNRIKELLDQNHLTDKSIASVVGGLAKGYEIVRPDAASLLLSILADKIAVRLGLDTATPKQLDFAFNISNALGCARSERSGLVEGMLATGISTLNIPSQINSLSFKRYLEIRQSFADFRPLFSAFIDNLKVAQRLDRFQDPNLIIDRVYNSLKEFQKEYLRYRRTKFSRSFKEWMPFTLSSAIALGAQYTSDSELLRSLAQMGFVIGLGTKLFLNSDEEAETVPLYRGLSKIRGKIIRTSLFERLST